MNLLCQQYVIATQGGSIYRDDFFGRKTLQIMGAAGFRSRAGFTSTAEWLRADDRTNNVAIDINIADAQLRRERLCFTQIARVYAAGEAEAECIDGVDDGVGIGLAVANDMQDWSKGLAFELL